MAQAIASYFASIVKVSLDKHFGSQGLSSMCTLSKFNQKTFYFMPATSYEIYDIISSLKNKNSSGPDGVTTKILKSIKNLISLPLAKFLNASIRQGEFPYL